MIPATRIDLRPVRAADLSVLIDATVRMKERRIGLIRHLLKEKPWDLCDVFDARARFTQIQGTHLSRQFKAFGNGPYSPERPHLLFFPSGDHVLRGT